MFRLLPVLFIFRSGFKFLKWRHGKGHRLELQLESLNTPALIHWPQTEVCRANLSSLLHRRAKEAEQAGSRAPAEASDIGGWETRQPGEHRVNHSRAFPTPTLAHPAGASHQPRQQQEKQSPRPNTGATVMALPAQRYKRDRAGPKAYNQQGK